MTETIELIKAPEPVRHVFAFDPGDVNNGFCYFRYSPEKKMADLRIMQVLDEKTLKAMLKVIWGIGQKESATDGRNPRQMYFVVENFRVDSKVRGAVFQWSQLETVRNIGKIQLLADLCEGEVILQEPSVVWPMARKWAIPYPFNRINKHPEDEKSAWCHGAAFMMNRRWINTVDQITMFGQERM